MAYSLHLFVEKLDKHGKWSCVFGPNWYREMWLGWLADAEEEGITDRVDAISALLQDEPELIAEGWVYTGRNENVYAILAGVRYPSISCGERTEDYVPIAEPKGLPSDVSPCIKLDAERMVPDTHHHSWVTLNELLAYDWSRMVRFSGFIDTKEAEMLRATGMTPSTYYFYLQDLGITNLEYATWQVPCRDRVKDFLDAVIPTLSELAEGEPDNVRLVFWFTGGIV